MSKSVGRVSPRGKNGSLTAGAMLGRVLVPSVGVGFGLGAIWAIGSLLTANAIPSPAATANAVAKPQIISIERALAGPKAANASFGAIVRAHKDIAAHAAGAVAAKGKSVRISNDVAGEPAVLPPEDVLKARFEKVAKLASLTPAKLADIFADAGMAPAKSKRVVTASVPAPERFAAWAEKAEALPIMAYADPSPKASAAALAALSAALPEDETLGVEPDAEDEVVTVPDEDESLENVPVPLRKPKIARSVDEDDDLAPALPKAERSREVSIPEIEKPKKPEKPAQKLAFAKPDDPRGDGLGQGLKNLFSRPKVGNGVAVYDISAAKVYMPDGSVLEAHSGIGKMADNPNYVHVKMNGPTPPHTYNLKMREKRFHGVEAIRMLPADGRNKHGRDGFLTHSYLLRGGRAESHGCVAFKNYDKFLNAFKQGKIRQLIVVPGGGKSLIAKGGKASPVRVASSGRDA